MCFSRHFFGNLLSGKGGLIQNADESVGMAAMGRQKPVFNKPGGLLFEVFAVEKSVRLLPDGCSMDKFPVSYQQFLAAVCVSVMVEGQSFSNQKPYRYGQKQYKEAGS